MSTALSANQQVIISALAVTGAKPQAPVKAKFTSVVDGAKVIDTEGFNAATAEYEVDIAAYDQNLKGNARDIKVLLGGKSKVGEQLLAMDKAMDPENDGGKTFVGTVVSVHREESSTRAVVTLHTGTDREAKDVPKGCETVRTERTDNPDGRATARAAQLLVGHRAVVYVELEAIRGGSTKVRVVRHFTDEGIDKRFDAATGTVTPS